MNKLRRGFSHRAFCGFGIIHLQIGLACIVLGIAAMVLPCSVDVPILAISAAVSFILTGLACLWSVWKKTDASIITSMVLSIISAVFCLVMAVDFGFHIPFVLSEHSLIYLPTPYPAGLEPISQTEMVQRLSVNSVLTVLSILEGVMAIVTSGFCCRTICCQQPQQMYSYHQIPMTSLPGGQLGGLVPASMPAYDVQNTTPLEDEVNITAEPNQNMQLQDTSDGQNHQLDMEKPNGREWSATVDQNHRMNSEELVKASDGETTLNSRPQPDEQPA